MGIDLYLSTCVDTQSPKYLEMTQRHISLSGSKRRQLGPSCESLFPRTLAYVPVTAARGPLFSPSPCCVYLSCAPSLTLRLPVGPTPSARFFHARHFRPGPAWSESLLPSGKSGSTSTERRESPGHGLRRFPRI
jgi:hypothetical protein